MFTRAYGTAQNISQLPAEKKQPTLEERVAAFKEFMHKATLEQMNSRQLQSQV